MGKYSNKGKKFIRDAKIIIKNLQYSFRVIWVEVFYASYAYMLIAEKLV